jgi:hypothetical protein
MVAVTVSLAGCDRGSPAYNRIKDLPYSQWDKYAATLPVEQRLDLHKEIMERSGHNPKMTIGASFSTNPESTYKSLVDRIRRGDNSRYYLGVIYEINRSPSFKICDQPDRKVVQGYLGGIVSYPGQKQYRPDFYDC